VLGTLSTQLNRRFGIYDARNIDIYYDARIVAEGRSEDEMLKKFTKEAKQKLGRYFE
jgi:hypothetical protein